jgi:hypothetical protein
MAGAQQLTRIGSPIIASYHVTGMCLDVRASDNAVLLWSCHGGANQAFRFASGNYGQISLGNGQCLTGGAKGTGLTAQRCDSANRSQKWGFQSDGTLRNELSLCADVEGGSRNQGTRVISWDCNARASNQLWYPALSTPKVQLSLQQYSAASKGPMTGFIASSGVNASNMVAAGGGNMVAAGGMNMVAAGGGNLVVGGAGRLISNMVAAGGGNLVAAGGGNAVPTGAGNLLPNNFNFFNGSGLGNLVGNDGAS